MRKQYGALVVGAGIAGIRAALDLAVTGHKVALIDKRPSHGGILSSWITSSHRITAACAACFHS